MTQLKSFAATESRADSEPRWQQRKAAMTRESILQAGIDCLVERGYAGLTTSEVVRRANISRGAMHHHFANRSELVAALIDFVQHRRLEFFLSEYLGSLRDAEPKEAIQLATDLHWQSVLTPEYSAYLELAMAARTDADLAAVLVPATKAFDKEWMDKMEDAFPQWDGRHEALHLASDFAAALHLGLLINRPFLGNPERRSAVRQKLIEVVKQIYADSD
ncbi:TetR/AcrR family transcriptional regulator [Erythrobacter sp. SCSIO 43205]|uniref:TetR/AcrR family transcriptional regulator n=1 Tax=Erythrobacter sp. SCSIO 43205 TaxID=2779361 RepID=UPI001CA8C78A|nr:TetR/AcrR family transcriptional regulator [Erythrobacter sp. SCSIO 43205]UAB79320.1 TetR/AcrR family transcriptional regulator [Erythrobacter sp. SCSIO 43205]